MTLLNSTYYKCIAYHFANITFEHSYFIEFVYKINFNFQIIIQHKLFCLLRQVKRQEVFTSVAHYEVALSRNVIAQSLRVPRGRTRLAFVDKVVVQLLCPSPGSVPTRLAPATLYAADTILLVSCKIQYIPILVFHIVSFFVIFMLFVNVVFQL